MSTVNHHFLKRGGGLRHQASATYIAILTSIRQHDREGLIQGVTMVLPETSGDINPGLFSHLGSCV